MPFFLLVAAVGIIAVALLFLVWRSMDRRIQQAFGVDTIEGLTQRLEQALEQQQHLTNRIEHLEAIIASEPWDADRQDQHATPPLALPDAEADASSEQRTPAPGRRQPNR